jgi:hypothetical protein
MERFIHLEQISEANARPQASSLVVDSPLTFTAHHEHTARTARPAKCSRHSEILGRSLLRLRLHLRHRERLDLRLLASFHDCH